MTKSTAILLALTTTLFALSLVLAQTQSPDTINLENSHGTVTLDHAGHAKRLGPEKCSTCHHTSTVDAQDYQKCSNCHAPKKVKKDGVTIPSAKTAFHKSCRGCHKAESKGPLSCRECHKKGDPKTSD
ncbi:cytochrome c3 family protein [bacterium]|nr:cytochrome c3 family protein [bacterium]